MFDNKVLDVVIGLIFIFLLYSLLVSVFQEILARIFNLRARVLTNALRRMLQDSPRSRGFTFINFFVDLKQGVKNFFFPVKEGTFLECFYDYPSIKYLGKNSTDSKPSYLEAPIFSKTIIQIIRGEGYNQSLNQMQIIRNNISHGTIGSFSIDPETKRYLAKLWMDSNNDLEHFRSNLEEWFNNTMDRATGWYKNLTHKLSIIIGFVVAIAFNVDTIAIVNTLSANDTIRKDVVDFASKNYTKFNPRPAGHGDETIRENNKEITIRYVYMDNPKLDSVYNDLKSAAAKSQQLLGLGRTECGCIITNEYQSKSGFIRFLGWLLTALAISFGAPFWFDLLNKFMLLRNSGVKPAEGDKNEKKNNQGTPPVQPVG